MSTNNHNNHHSDSSKKFEEALELLNAAAREKKDELQGLLTDKYTDIRKIIEGTAKEQTKNFKRAQRVAGKWINENEETLRDMASEVDEEVRQRPWQYIAGAAVGALLLGFILGSSSRNK